MNKQSKWYASMLLRYGSEAGVRAEMQRRRSNVDDKAAHEALKARLGSDQAISEYYRNLQKKSRENYSGTGGFAYLKKHNPNQLKAISDKGVKAKREAK